MTLRNIRIGISCGALALAACSSTTLTGNSPEDGVDGSSNNTGGSEQANGGQAGSSGGVSAGGASSGGASSGGTSAGGASSGGTHTGGTSSGGTHAGGTSSGGAADAGKPASGGANGADAATDAGGGNAGAGGNDGSADSGGTDGSAGSGGASSGGASDGGTRPKRVFVTSEAWSGDLKTAGHEASGIQSANRLCQAAATALGGSWIAWVSDSKSNVLDRIRDVGPWYRLDGVKVFEDKAALTGTPLVPINLNESGGPTGVVLPWTGTFGQGVRDPGDLNINCVDWTDDTDITLDGGTLAGLCGTTGLQATVGDHWTSNSFSTCSMKRNLFCFEQ